MQTMSKFPLGEIITEIVGKFKHCNTLQEYLSEAKEGGSFGAIAGVPYRFIFYLHNKPEKQPRKAATNLTMKGGSPHQE